MPACGPEFNAQNQHLKSQVWLQTLLVLVLGSLRQADPWDLASKPAESQGNERSYFNGGKAKQKAPRE